MKSGRVWLLALASLLLPACRSSGPPSDQVVAECREYEVKWAKCTGNRSAIAAQPDLLAKTESDRARLKKVCASNLELLKQGCR
jgi:hypothetical protein